MYKNNPYYQLIATIIKLILVVIVVILGWRVYKTIKTALAKDYRLELKTLPFANKEFYKAFYKNVQQYTNEQKARFLRNYNYEDSFFYAVGSDISSLRDELLTINPILAIRNAARILTNSGVIEGTQIIKRLSEIKSQIMFSMMLERYYVKTGDDLIDVFLKCFDGDTIKAIYKHLKSLPLSVD